MAESVHCPNCATHYALRPPRVMTRHRRAKCFRCDSIFSITDQVHLLMGKGVPSHETSAEPTAATAASRAEGAETMGIDPHILTVHTVSTTGINPEDVLAIHDFEITGDHLPARSDSAATQATDPLLGDSHEPVPSLTLHDLDEPESAMEKTLILAPGAHLNPHPHSAPLPTHAADQLDAMGLMPLPPAEAHVEEESAPGTGTYSSARDAIDKLLSGTPTPQRQRLPSLGRASHPMDLEQSLSALEATLGGTRAMPPLEEVGSTMMLSPKELDRAMIAQTSDPEPTATTRHLSPEDLPLENTPLDDAPMAPTMMMNLSELMPPQGNMAATLSGLKPAPMIAPAPVSMAAPEMATAYIPRQTESVVNDPNLLKVQLEQDTLSNVGMDQLIQMVEQGRVKDYHLVARQFSENWLEASKVPALRPVFERMRRITQMGPAPVMPSETAPVKKSLFGGLFGGKS